MYRSSIVASRREPRRGNWFRAAREWSPGGRGHRHGGVSGGRARGQGRWGKLRRGLGGGGSKGVSSGTGSVGWSPGAGSVGRGCGGSRDSGWGIPWVAFGGQGQGSLVTREPGEGPGANSLSPKVFNCAWSSCQNWDEDGIFLITVVDPPRMTLCQVKMELDPFVPQGEELD